MADMSSFPGWGKSPGGRIGNALSITVWKMTWTEGPGGLQTMRSPRDGHN